MEKRVLEEISTDTALQVHAAVFFFPAGCSQVAESRGEDGTSICYSSSANFHFKHWTLCSSSGLRPAAPPLQRTNVIRLLRTGLHFGMSCLPNNTVESHFSCLKVIKKKTTSLQETKDAPVVVKTEVVHEDDVWNSLWFHTFNRPRVAKLNNLFKGKLFTFSPLKKLCFSSFSCNLCPVMIPMICQH